VQYGAKRPDVHRRSDRLASSLLGGHVAVGSSWPSRRSLAGGLCTSEVDQDRSTISHHDVVRLDIKVNHSEVMNVPKNRRELQRESKDVVANQRLTSDHRRKRLTFE
jgi:hypothetical protein